MIDRFVVFFTSVTARDFLVFCLSKLGNPLATNVFAFMHCYYCVLRFNGVIGMACRNGENGTVDFEGTSVKTVLTLNSTLRNC